MATYKSKTWGVITLRFRHIQTAGVILLFTALFLRFYVLDESVNPLFVQIINYSFLALLIVILGLQYFIFPCGVIHQLKGFYLYPA